MSMAVLCGVQSTCNEADAFLLCGNPGTGLMRSYMLFAQKTVCLLLSCCMHGMPSQFCTSERIHGAGSVCPHPGSAPRS